MEITLKPTVKQDKAWKYLEDRTTLFIAFGGGAGGGKSWLACEWLLTLCKRYPGLRAFMGREELARLKKSSYITWQKVCKHHGLIREVDWHYNGSDNFIEVFNKDAETSRIDLLDLKYLPSDPEYERFGSLEYTVGWIEEGSEVDFGAFDVLKSRVGRHENDKFDMPGKLLVTLNPTKSWPYRVFYKPWKDGTLQEEYAFIQSLYMDNPYTAEIYKKQLDSLTSKVKKARLRDGKWEYDDDSGSLMSYDNINDIFTNVLDDEFDNYLTCDVARFGGDYIVIYVWLGFWIRKIHVYEKQKVTWTAGKVKEISHTERIPRSRIIIDEDGVGGGVLDDVDGARGFVANSSPLFDPEEDSPELEKNYQNLKSQCGYKLAKYVNGHFISAEGFELVTDIEGLDEEKVKEMIIEDLEQVKEAHPDEDKKKALLPKEEVKENIGRSPDFGDNFIMRMHFTLKKPVAHGQYRPSWISRKSTI